MEEKENKIKKEVKKIRSNVTLALIIFTVTLILSTLYLIHLSNILLLFYFIGVIFGFIGLTIRSISMWDYIDKKEYIDKKGNIKYRWYEVNEQCKIIKYAYFFKYSIFIILTILAFISFALLTLDILEIEPSLKPVIGLIFVGSLSVIVGFVLKSPGWFS